MCAGLLPVSPPSPLRACVRGRVKPAPYPSEYRMLSIEVRAWRERDEKLAPVCIRASVRHGKYSSTRVPQLGVDLIVKLAAVHRGTAPARSARIASLDHEAGNYPVEDCAVVVATVVHEL